MRIKRGKVKNQKHKKVLKAAKGYQLTYSKRYRRAKEALLHAGSYSFAHRKRRQSQFRRLWIQRINAGLTPHNIKYSRFIGSLKSKNVDLDRRVLASLALDFPTTFEKVVEFSK
jgi:large subunit ribosomal protein L20